MKKFFTKFNGFYAALILIVIIAVLHIDIITAHIGYYFSGFDLKDLNYYINIRQYTVNSVLSGFFPFWTTKLFCGMPFFSNSETAIFYLPNIIFYFLPISKAFNISFLLHFFIFSFGVFLWIDNKIKDKFVSVTAALVSVFFSTYYLHSCAAHLSNIITISWFPLLLYFYDKVYEKRNFYFIFPVSVIISLQIFAGHFQYVYYSALFSLIYVLLFCRNKHTIITIFVSCFVSLFLSAIQFLPSLDLYFEGARRLGVLAHFSLYSKLTYLFTIIFPVTVPSMSTWYWETSNYIGTISFFIIVFALVHVKNKDIYKYLVFSLSIYLFSFEFFSNLANYCIPFFSAFRSPVKLNFFVTVFMLPVLAYGIKYIFSKDTKINKKFVLILLICALIMVIFRNNIVNLLTDVLHKTNGFSILCFDLSVMSLTVIILLFSVLLCFKKYSISKIVLLILLLIEPIAVMRFCSRPFHFYNDYKYKYTLGDNFNKQKRFFSNDYYNLNYNAENVSGSTPDTLSNYLTFMKHLGRPFNAQNMLGLLRCGYIVDDVTKEVETNNFDTLSRLNVYYDYKVEVDKEKIYEKLSEEQFDIFNTVIVEKHPQYEIKDKGKYNLNITHFDENSIDFDIETTQPAIILYTDNYSKDWYAYNIENPKEKYEIVCADYIYKAISVNEGKHKIRIEYKPKSFIAGMYISIISWLLFVLFAVFLICKKIMKTK
ncbi:MAG: YfhO family protein [Endomicrobiaceae bacterium]|nr:YfhO family protein [Endomicrobiaceae bacterium]